MGKQFWEIISQDRVEQAIAKEALREAIVPELKKFLDDLNKQPNGRASGWHASQLFKMCPRKEILSRLFPDLAQYEKIKPQLRVIFDVGHAVHKWFQNQYYGPMQVLRGDWVCLRCSHKEHGFMPKTAHGCNGEKRYQVKPGGNRFWRFVEMFARNAEWNICGSIDGLLTIRGGTSLEEELILDIKTANPYSWKIAEDASDAYKYQMRIYQWLFKMKRGVIQYIDKGGSTSLFPIKEFIVEYDEKTPRNAQMRIRVFRESVKEKSLPPRARECQADRDCWKAKDCAWAKLCFEEGADKANLEERMKEWKADQVEVKTL